MTFFKREQRYADGLERLEKTPAAEAFRRDIHQLKLTASQALNPRPLFPLGNRTIDKRRRELPRLQRIHLVLHQRNQR